MPQFMFEENRRCRYVLVGHFPHLKKNEDFSTLFVFLSQQNRRKKTFSADRVLSSSVNLPKASFMISENIKNIILDVAGKAENEFLLISCVVRKINIVKLHTSNSKSFDDTLFHNLTNNVIYYTINRSFHRF